MEPTRSISVTRFQFSEHQRVDDVLIQEQRVTILVDSEQELETVCSPGKLRELAYGHLLATGAIGSATDIAAVDVDLPAAEPAGATIAVKLAAGMQFQSRPTGPDVVQSAFSVPADFIAKMVQAAEDHGDLFRLTGGTHLAAIVPSDSDGIFVEDISRTCALEKVLGSALLRGAAFYRSLLVLTSRIPMQFVQTAAHAGIPIIGAVSAPTYQAVEEADRLGICLCGFVRGERFNVYSHPWRVGLQ
ncbi:formate dehydrogenase accessory sulfurtransferase FdhD [Candidatus Bipolaricaulota bacterium]|nr:formate dehydrogenase accessory sulfurtransferase FdhD [Candidatus Bipolaricaulota bacterium]